MATFDAVGCSQNSGHRPLLAKTAHGCAGGIKCTLQAVYAHGEVSRFEALDGDKPSWIQFRQRDSQLFEFVLGAMNF